ncbi:MAG: hypothetical protein RBS08_08455 [Bdellovibrionales bacterium]|jgi:hypothetical protein|nr:hypothetical protein [Bdellovibrionales bacterium]
MEPNKSQKGSLVSAFRKAVLTVVAGVALTAGAAQEANAQTVTYGNQGVSATQQQPMQKPWAHEPMYQNQIRVQMQQDEINMRQAQSRARAQLAQVQQQRTQALAQNNQNIQRLRARSGTNALDYATAASRWAAQEQGFRARVEQIHLNVETVQLRQEQNMMRLVDRLDNQFSRQEPYKSMLQNPRR